MPESGSGILLIVDDDVFEALDIGNPTAKIQKCFRVGDNHLGNEVLGRIFDVTARGIEGC